ncbi:hypothetical protein [Steroidobacter sp.]|uniref:hypothetical protein n=1 Tax=Steroidobacter sp. TaxID=1978227 RepID=UPI001A3FCF96|nr:hypothetical protein [Steroidobacter sp.]MBL8264853.1 hypothetical protein [Steroidobacter sp.]
MKRSLAALLSALLLLSACGGGGSDTDPPNVNPDSGSGHSPDDDDTDDSPDSSDYTPEPTEVGTPIGNTVSVTIGVAGGQLTSDDGAVTVDVPAGAFDQDRTLAIQQITNTAHGAKGRAYRISPEGLHTTTPMTIRWQYTDDDVLGTDAAALTIAYQDSARLWHVYKEPTRDVANRTLSVSTTHFSDWSLVVGVQLTPKAVTLNVGQSAQFQVILCDEFEDDEQDNGELPVPTVAYRCRTTPGTSFLAGDWAVNGAIGGSARHGTIVADTDELAGRATYTAPATRPTPNVVAVSARYRAEDSQQLLVSNVTIVDDAATCDRLSTVQEFRAEVSFDHFNFTSTAEDRVHTGAHQGRLTSTLRKVDTGATFGFWTTGVTPLESGFVSVNDNFSYTPSSGDGYTGSLTGSGPPTTPGSMIAMTIDYATCTFDLHASYTVDAVLLKAGNSIQAPQGVGILYLHDQAIPLAQLGGTIDGERNVVAGTDPDATNYIPAHDVHVEWSEAGSTTARWTLTTVQ